MATPRKEKTKEAQSKVFKGKPQCSTERKVIRLLERGLDYAAALTKYENAGGKSSKRFSLIWDSLFDEYRSDGKSAKSKSNLKRVKSKAKEAEQSVSQIKVELPEHGDKIIFGEKKKATKGFEFLSSMAVAPIYVYIGKGKFLTFVSCEQAFHYFKTLDEEKREIIYKCIKPTDAKYHGSEKSGCVMRDDWEEIKDDVMFEIEFARFSQNVVMRELLMATKDTSLIECAPWEKESYWGTNLKLVGKNQKGKTLEKVRSKLIKLRDKDKLDYYTADMRKYI